MTCSLHWRPAVSLHRRRRKHESHHLCDTIGELPRTYELSTCTTSGGRVLTIQVNIKSALLVHDHMGVLNEPE